MEQRYNTPEAFKGNVARHPKEQQTLDQVQSLQNQITTLKAIPDPEGNLQAAIADKEKQLQALQAPSGHHEEHDLAFLQSRKAELLDKHSTKKTQVETEIQQQKDFITAAETQFLQYETQQIEEATLKVELFKEQTELQITTAKQKAQ